MEDCPKCGTKLTPCGDCPESYDWCDECKKCIENNEVLTMLVEVRE